MTQRYAHIEDTVEAFQITKDTLKVSKKWPQWLRDAYFKEDGVAGKLSSTSYLAIDPLSYPYELTTIFGIDPVNVGDWIIKGETENDMLVETDEDFRRYYVPAHTHRSDYRGHITDEELRAIGKAVWDTWSGGKL